jgi:hypothetical protein
MSTDPPAIVRAGDPRSQLADPATAGPDTATAGHDRTG